jgi:hypothetical protein
MYCFIDTESDTVLHSDRDMNCPCIPLEQKLNFIARTSYNKSVDKKSCFVMLGLRFSKRYEEFCPVN